MSVFFRVHIDAAVAAVSRKAYLGYHYVSVGDEHLEDLDSDEVRAVIDESSPSIEQTDGICETFHIQLVPQSFPDDPTLIVKMLACAKTKATKARVALAHQELQDIELGRVPDARVLGTVVGEFFVPRPALGLDATKDKFEMELDRIRSRIPGIEGGVIAMKPKGEPFDAVPLHSIAEKACATPELQCAAILERLYWNVADVSEINDPEDIIMLVSTKEPSLFDADFPVMDGSFSPRKSPSKSAISTLASICQRTGMGGLLDGQTERSEASADYQYKMIASVVRYTPEGGGSPITGVLVECRVRRIADGEECIRGLFVPTEA